MTDRLNGLILAGGKSSRMGFEKMLIDYHGKPQREHLFDLLSPLCNLVFTSVKTDEEIPAKLNPLPDTLDIEGPLNGILTAFRHDRNCAWMTVPIDMPLVDQGAINSLLSARDSNCIATCFLDSSGQNPEPLLTIWEPDAHTPLELFYQSGGYSPRTFLSKHSIRMIHAPDPKVLANINSQEELKNFLASGKNLRGDT